MHRLLGHAIETEMLVVATSNADLVEWDDHPDLRDIFPKVEYLFDGGRAMVARDVWHKTLRDNPALADHMNAEEWDRMCR